MLHAKGKRVIEDWEGETLYSDGTYQWEEVDLTFVPYCYWGNRGYGEMMVWVKELVF